MESQLVDAPDEVELSVLAEGWNIGAPIGCPMTLWWQECTTLHKDSNLSGHSPMLKLSLMKDGRGNMEPHHRSAHISVMADPEFVAQDFHLPQQ
jgi:hypothetical protein